MNSIEHRTVTIWETHEGGTTGYNEPGAIVIDIAPLANRAACTKWNMPYVPGRAWIAHHENGTVTRGRADNLAAARKAATAALAAYPERNLP